MTVQLGRLFPDYDNLTVNRANDPAKDEPNYDKEEEKRRQKQSARGLDCCKKKSPDS